MPQWSLFQETPVFLGSVILHLEKANQVNQSTDSETWKYSTNPHYFRHCSPSAFLYYWTMGKILQKKRKKKKTLLFRENRNAAILAHKTSIGNIFTLKWALLSRSWHFHTLQKDLHPGNAGYGLLEQYREMKYIYFTGGRKRFFHQNDTSNVV